jgi:predicted amidophosphoribosyltransferase
LEALAARVGPAWPVEPDLVVKTAETPGMTGLGWAARQGVARGPLRRSQAPGRDGGLEGSRVLVLDDVFTEGGTMQQVAEVLRRMGASDVAGLVLARPVWQPAPPGGDAGRGSTVQA